MKKTIKKRTLKKKKRDIKPLSEIKIHMPASTDMPSKAPAQASKAPVSKRWNEDFIKILDELADIMQRQGEPFKSRAYQKAQETIMTYEGDINNLAQITDLPGIGKTISSKLEEYMQTGTLQILERERANPVNLLTKVYGIGPKKADELVKAGIKTIADLRKQPELLNDVQRIGLNYFEAIETRIPRREIDTYNKLFTRIFKETAPPGSHMEIVGSYRRGAQNSGDIDIIITNENNDNTVMKTFMDRLIKDKIVTEILSRGKTKSLTIAKLPMPIQEEDEETIPRRVDFLYTPPDEFAFALLYFTGSKIFNTVQRQRALKMGYSLNEHGLYQMEQGQKGAKIKGDFPTEQSIFAVLNMAYKEPRERIDGRSVQEAQAPAAPVSVAPVSVAPASVAPVSVAPASVAPAVKIKRKTLKIKPAQAQQTQAQQAQAQAQSNTLLPLFKKTGITALQASTEDELSQLIRAANDAYYCNQAPLMTDNEYDVLREYTLERFPANIAANEGHTQCAATEKNKVKLPYEMWSMDKIKPDTNALVKWQQTYSGPYVLSCKLDGVSGLYSTEGPVPKLYTRGNGLVGQDISHFLPYFNLPKVKDITLRGEFIIKKELFQTKYAAEFANPRNFVAGVINQKKPDPQKAADLDFVAYEVLKPILKPSAQMEFLGGVKPPTTNKAKTKSKATTNGLGGLGGRIPPTAYKVVEYMTSPTISNEMLSEVLVKWRAEYAYEIDGVICINDAVYPRQTGNPAHAFAFKMVLSEQIAEAKVVGVIWTASKDGYLKPRVQIEPVKLGGVKIVYATGFNAKFIEDNKIGVGALIRLMRSGDVIPHIISVVQPAEQPQMPTVPYEWNSTHVDIMLQNKEEDATVLEKNITLFFSSIEVDGLAGGNVKKIMAAGFKTVPRILAMSTADFLTVAGFKEKMATKIKESISVQVEKASLAELMHATNLFGRGFGTKKFQLILTAVPNILTLPPAEGIVKATAVEGMAKKTAEQFVQQIPAFLAFLAETNLLGKLQQQPVATVLKDTTHPLYGKQYIMTGFRDKELQEKLAAVGAEQGSAVRKNTFVVLVKDLAEANTKVAEAKKIGIPIMTPTEFKTKYNI
jgi:NAD-dependent DNA ligase/DNA polymerase/3'-5' exonuclease PolX